MTELLDAQERMKELINQYRMIWMNDYFTYDGKQWDCDDQGVVNILATVLMGIIGGQQLPPNAVFRDRDNVNHPVDFMYMVVMALTCFQFKQAVYQTSWELKNQIDSLTNVEEVLAFAYEDSNIWPTK